MADSLEHEATTVIRFIRQGRTPRLPESLLPETIRKDTQARVEELKLLPTPEERFRLILKYKQVVDSQYAILTTISNTIVQYKGSHFADFQGVMLFLEQINYSAEELGRQVEELAYVYDPSILKSKENSDVL